MSDLDVSVCTQIHSLYCSRTKLISLDVSACAAMRWLHCSDTKIESLELGHMLVLERLWVSGTPIMSVNVVGLPKMKVVYGCDIEGRDVKTGSGVDRK